uniref:Uncharacterized protein n=1 Tax=Rhizophora mucronata TaxID=61149 RepID=A0A2P2JWV2_RHIMU
MRRLERHEGALTKGSKLTTKQYNKLLTKAGKANSISCLESQTIFYPFSIAW